MIGFFRSFGQSTPVYTWADQGDSEHFGFNLYNPDASLSLAQPVDLPGSVVDHGDVYGVLDLANNRFGMAFYFDPSGGPARILYQEMQCGGTWGDTAQTYTPSSYDTIAIVQEIPLLTFRGILRLSSGGIVAVFNENNLVGTAVRYHFYYRNPAGSWQSVVQADMPKLSSESTNHTAALAQHPNGNIYFFRYLENDTAVGLIKLVESSGNVAVVGSPSNSYIGAADAFPPFVGLPQLRAGLDPYRNGIFLAYQSSTSATLGSSTGTRIAVCFISQTEAKSFTQMTSEWIEASSAFVVGVSRNAGTFWCAASFLDAVSGSPKPVQIAAYLSGNWQFNTTSIPAATVLYPVRDDFGASYTVGELSSGLVWINAGNLNFVSFTSYPFVITVSLSASSASVADTGGSGSVNVTAPDGFAWTAVSNVPWITVTSGASGIGNGTVGYTVSANTGTARQGTITIDGQTYTVNEAAAASPGALKWVKAMPGTAPYSATCSAVASDSFGNVIAVGGFGGTVNLGEGLVTNTEGYNAGAGRDIFIVKYDVSGAVLWTKHCGASGNDAALAVAVDSQNNIIVAGGFHGTVDFGGTSLTASGGGFDAFVAKYSSAGTLTWAKRFGGTFDEVVQAVAVDSADNILLACKWQSVPGDFGGTSLSSSGWTDVAIGKLSPAGNVIWAKVRGAENEDIVYGIAVDNSNNVWVTGQYFTSTNFGGATFTNTGNGDAFIAKYSGTDGSHLFSRGTGTAGVCAGKSITVDPATGNVVVTGIYRGLTDFGNGPVGSSGSGTFFMAAYNSSGAYLWLVTQGDSADIGNAIKIRSGKLAVTGAFNSYMDFNLDGFNDAGGTGLFLAVFSIAGNSPPTLRWVKRSATGNGNGFSVAFDTLGNVVIGGNSQFTTDFGGTTSTVPTGSTGAFSAQYSV